MAIQCLDDPATILQKEWCVTALSKDLSGTLHRPPALPACQKCEDRGVMEGRLCGKIVSTANPALNGCQLMADYRIKFDPSTTGGQGGIRGTLEGVIICSCQQ